MGKDHKEEIEKICKDMHELIMKQNHNPQEVEVMHYYSEMIYYLTAVDAMNQAEEEGMYSMANGGQSGMYRPMPPMPMYDYSRDGGYDGQSMRNVNSNVRGGNRGGNRGRSNARGNSYDGSYDGSYEGGQSMDGYSEAGGGQSGHMPRPPYDWEGREYSERRY